MYIPQHFRMPDERVADYLAGVRAGNLITMHESGIEATFLPFIFEQRDGQWFLITHLVRNNPQVRTPMLGDALAIVDIADVYLSPEQYATNQDVPSVPTWNYITLHLRGKAEIDPSPDAALEAAQVLTDRLGESWSTKLVGPERLERMSRAIVAVEMRIDEIQAKAKMSQNRHPDDVESVRAHYVSEGEDTVANYLEEVSLPYAKARFEMITDLKSAGASQWAVRPAQ